MLANCAFTGAQVRAVHQTEHDQSGQSLQREVGAGPVEVLGHVGHYTHPEGRLPYTLVFPRVPPAVPLSDTKETTGRGTYGRQVRTFSVAFVRAC